GAIAVRCSGRDVLGACLACTGLVSKLRVWCVVSGGWCSRCAPGSFVWQCPVGDVLGGCGGGRVPHVLAPGRSLPTVLGICGVRVGALPDLRGVPAPVGGGALRPYAGRRRDGRSAGTGSRSGERRG